MILIRMDYNLQEMGKIEMLYESAYCYHVSNLYILLYVYMKKTNYAKVVFSFVPHLFIATKGW